MSTNEEQLIRWDIGTAYDFFASLVVLHNPERYGLRGSWAAGVRSRLPAAERETLPSCWEVLWPMRWVYTLPAPKDAATALAVLEQATAATRLRADVYKRQVWPSTASRPPTPTPWCWPGR